MIERESIANKLIKKNVKYKSFKRKLENGVYYADTTKYMQEMQNMHISRKIRITKSSDLLSSNQKNLLEISLQNQAYRSRIVEIQIDLTKQMNAIDAHIDNLKTYLGIKYNDIIKREFRTAAERTNFLDDLFRDAMTISSQLDSALDIIKILIQDIDQASFCIRHLISVLELGIKKDQNF